MKEGLELAVERLKEEEGVRSNAIEHLRKEIKTSTSSMTSVPKPLKFLRSHYNTIKEIFENIKGDKVNIKKKFTSSHILKKKEKFGRYIVCFGNDNGERGRKRFP